MLVVPHLPNLWLSIISIYDRPIKTTTKVPKTSLQDMIITKQQWDLSAYFILSMTLQLSADGWTDRCRQKYYLPATRSIINFYHITQALEEVKD